MTVANRFKTPMPLILTLVTCAIVLGPSPTVAAQSEAPPKPDADKPDADKTDIPKKPSTPPQQLFEGPPVPKPSAASLRGARPGAIPKPTVQLKPGQIPAIRFDTPVYDFGRVLSGSKVNHDYWFTNDGSGPVEILAVKPSCGCTASGDFDRIVEPGESGRIPIEVDTAKLKGSVTKSVTIHTNIAAPNKTVLLQIKGDVWNLIEVRPTAANFGKLTGTAQRKLVITNNSEQVAELSDIQSNSPMFKAEIRVIEPGKKFELIVTAQATGSGQASGKITMSTGIADHPTLEVFANAHVPPAVEVGPRLIKLRPAAPGTQQKQRVYVRNNQPEKPLEITDLKVSNPDIKLSLDEQVPGTKFQIILEFPDGYRAPPGGDRLTFSTNAASMPTVQVPILQTGGRIARRPAPRQNNPPAAAVNKPDQTGTNR